MSLLTLAPHFEDKTLQDVGKGDLMAFVSARRKEKVSPSTIRRDLACLSSVFSVAEDWDLCDGNPVLPFLRAQKRRGGLKESPPRVRYLSGEEELGILRLARAKFDACRLRDGAPNPRALTKLMILSAIAVAIDFGLSDEEQLRLRWPQVDFDRGENGEITVLASASKNKRERRVPLLPRTRAILSGLPRHPKTDLVFWHRNGVGFYDLNHTLQRLGAEVGVTGIRWHDLRRTCGCRLLQDHKMPIELVSFWLGHSSVVQTQRAYAFLKVDQLHESLGGIPTNVPTMALRESLKTVELIGDSHAEKMIS